MAMERSLKRTDDKARRKERVRLQLRARIEAHRTRHAVHSAAVAIVYTAFAHFLVSDLASGAVLFGGLPVIVVGVFYLSKVVLVDGASGDRAGADPRGPLAQVRAHRLPVAGAIVAIAAVIGTYTAVLATSFQKGLVLYGGVIILAACIATMVPVIWIEDADGRWG